MVKFKNWTFIGSYSNRIMVLATYLFNILQPLLCSATLAVNQRQSNWTWRRRVVGSESWAGSHLPRVTEWRSCFFSLAFWFNRHAACLDLKLIRMTARWHGDVIPAPNMENFSKCLWILECSVPSSKSSTVCDQKTSSMLESFECAPLLASSNTEGTELRRF